MVLTGYTIDYYGNLFCQQHDYKTLITLELTCPDFYFPDFAGMKTSYRCFETKQTKHHSCFW